MKAWYLDIKDDPDQGAFVVFANTRNEARSQAGSYDLIYDTWLDVQAIRFKPMDDKERLPRKELIRELWREHGWRWWDIDYPYPEDTTDAEFDVWYDKHFPSIEEIKRGL